MHADHDHGVETLDDRRLVLAVVVNLLLTLAQIIGGLLAGSLALVADALHNFSDAASLGVALGARRIARRPADRRRTFGYRRAEVIGALINLTTLVVVGLYLIYEAISRYFEQQPVDGWIVIIVAGVALVIDVATALLTYAGSRESMNIRAAFVHNVSDALASIGVIIAGSLILLYDWRIADLIATVVISAYILYQGLTMMRSSIQILMESVPEDVDVEQLVDGMLTVTGVRDVHHLHVWQLDEQHRALEAHVVVETEDHAGWEAIKRQLKELLAAQFQIDHSTLELESVARFEQLDHETTLITTHPEPSDKAEPRK